MSSTHLVIFLGAAIHGVLIVAWGSYKKRQSQKPVTMKLRRGVYVPWGPIERIQRFNKFAGYMGMVWFSLLACAILYAWLIGPVLP